jgi:hypothetical protein
MLHRAIDENNHRRSKVITAGLPSARFSPKSQSEYLDLHIELWPQFI